LLRLSKTAAKITTAATDIQNDRIPENANTGRCEVLLSFRKIQWDRIVLYLNIKFGTIPALNRIEEPNAVSNLVRNIAVGTNEVFSRLN
jgi:hypothetical protein